MDKCTECGRPLNEDEEDLCPACKSNKSYKKKKWVEIGAVVGAVLLFLGAWFRKGGGKA